MVAVFVVVHVHLSWGGILYADGKRCVELCMDISLKFEGEFEKSFETCKLYCKQTI